MPLTLKTRQQDFQYFSEPLTEVIELEMMFIPAGDFMMGCPEREDGNDDEKPQQPVSIAQFFMAKMPVTQAQWRAVASMPQIGIPLEPDPARFKGANRPVERVNWHEAIEFCQRLTANTHKTYTLPTEAMWEYTCRAGTETPFSFGETITSEVANYNGNYPYGPGIKGKYRKETTPVNFFAIANPFGLFDMHGNVWEWCLDPWHENYEGAPEDGSAWVSFDESSLKVLRGGSWNNGPIYCRSAHRYRSYPNFRRHNFGFRVVYIP